MKDVLKRCVDHVASYRMRHYNKHSEPGSEKSLDSFRDEAEREINNMTNLELLELIASVEDM